MEAVRPRVNEVSEEGKGSTTRVSEGVVRGKKRRTEAEEETMKSRRRSHSYLRMYPLHPWFPKGSSCRT